MRRDLHVKAASAFIFIKSGCSRKKPLRSLAFISIAYFLTMIQPAHAQESINNLIAIAKDTRSSADDLIKFLRDKEIITKEIEKSKTSVSALEKAKEKAHRDVIAARSTPGTSDSTIADLNKADDKAYLDHYTERERLEKLESNLDVTDKNISEKCGSVMVINVIKISSIEEEKLKTYHRANPRDYEAYMNEILNLLAVVSNEKFKCSDIARQVKEIYTKLKLIEIQAERYTPEKIAAAQVDRSKNIKARLETVADLTRLSIINTQINDKFNKITISIDDFSNNAIGESLKQALEMQLFQQPKQPWESKLSQAFTMIGVAGLTILPLGSIIDPKNDTLQTGSAAAGLFGLANVVAGQIISAVRGTKLIDRVTANRLLGLSLQSMNTKYQLAQREFEQQKPILIQSASIISQTNETEKDRRKQFILILDKDPGRDTTDDRSKEISKAWISWNNSIHDIRGELSQVHSVFGQKLDQLEQRLQRLVKVSASYTEMSTELKRLLGKRISESKHCKELNESKASNQTSASAPSATPQAPTTEKHFCDSPDGLEQHLATALLSVEQLDLLVKLGISSYELGKKSVNAISQSRDEISQIRKLIDEQKSTTDRLSDQQAGPIACHINNFFKPLGDNPCNP